MAEDNSGWRRVLQNPSTYEALQALMGSSQTRRQFIERYIRPVRNDRILDIGCGPAELLRYMTDVHYVGFDPNPIYIARAKTVFGSRGTFYAKAFTEEDVDSFRPFDIAILSAVLHHLDDEEARSLFMLLRRAVRPGGRVVTIDNVFIDNQNKIAKFIISRDRGRNVRTAEGYQSLAEGVFDILDTQILHKNFPPYTYFIMTAS